MDWSSSAFCGEEHAELFIVQDATGQALGYFYFEDEFESRSAVSWVFGSAAAVSWCPLFPPMSAAQFDHAYRQRIVYDDDRLQDAFNHKLN